jgi:hypothetical protein
MEMLGGHQKVMHQNSVKVFFANIMRLHQDP